MAERIFFILRNSVTTAVIFSRTWQRLPRDPPLQLTVKCAVCRWVWSLPSEVLSADEPPDEEGEPGVGDGGSGAPKPSTSTGLVEREA